MPVPQTRSISVFGLGKLGSPLAVALAHKGFHVIGVDVSGQPVNALNQGLAPVQEPGLQEMLDTAYRNVRATIDYEDAVLNSETSSIIVPTPTGPDGGFVLDHVIEVAQRIARELAKKQSYHLIAVGSTVMPGDSDRVRDAVESASGKLCGRDFGLCYSPFFIALGSVLHDLQHPDMLLIGQSDETAGDLYEAVLRQLTDNHPAVRRMNFVNAELTKLAVNGYITTKISYANMIARMCERMAGADASTVTGAMGMDGRIGSKYLTGGMAYGGPCFPRDNVALARVAEHLGTGAPIATATHTFNMEQSHVLAGWVGQHVARGARISVLGLSYKPDTSSVDELASIYLVQDLLAIGFSVTAYDPAAMANARNRRELGIGYAASLEDAVASADAIIIATPWKEFKDLNPESLRRAGNKVTIFDCWRILEADTYKAVARIVYLGVGPWPEHVAAG